MKHTIEERAVGSKILSAKVKDIVEDNFGHGGILWTSDTHRESLVAVVDDEMSQLAEDGKITQWDVICDLRNNKVADMMKHLYNFEVKYKQTNALNVTRLIWHVDDSDPDFQLDFTW